MNLSILKDSYPSDLEMSFDILNFVKGTQQLLPHNLMTYLAKELTNTKILQKMDENSEGSFHNMEEEVIKSIIPAIEHVMLIMQEIRGTIKAKRDMTHGFGFLDTKVMVQYTLFLH